MTLTKKQIANLMNYKEKDNLASRILDELTKVCEKIEGEKKDCTELIKDTGYIVKANPMTGLYFVTQAYDLYKMDGIYQNIVDKTKKLIEKGGKYPKNSSIFIGKVIEILKINNGEYLDVFYEDMVKLIEKDDKLVSTWSNNFENLIANGEETYQKIMKDVINANYTDALSILNGHKPEKTEKDQIIARGAKYSEIQNISEKREERYKNVRESLQKI